MESKIKVIHGFVSKFTSRTIKLAMLTVLHELHYKDGSFALFCRSLFGYRSVLALWKVYGRWKSHPERDQHP